MNIISERGQQTRLDRRVCATLSYLFILILSLWIGILVELPRELLFVGILIYIALGVMIVCIFQLYTRTRKRRAFEYPPLLSRSNSRDSGYISQYDSTTRPEAFDSITNEERVCQLCILREQEKVLRKEHEELSMKAHEAYKKHVEASRFLCEHDGLKTAIANTLSAGVGVDDMSLWYTADMERAKKGAELRVMEKKITKLREEMQQHFWDSV